MKYSLIALFFILNIVFATATETQQNVIQGKDLFNKLKKSGDIGKNLVATIQLELSTSSEDQTVVSKVVEMLREVEQSLLDQSAGFQAEVDAKDEQCYNALTGLKEEIADLEKRIDETQDKLPLRQDQYELKVSQETAASEEISFYLSEVVKLDAKNDAKKEAFDVQNEEYDQLIAALEQAKRLIKTLKNSFLQKNPNEANLAQVRSHFESALDDVKQPHNKAFLRYLLQITKVSDQDQVSSLVEILNDLIASTAETQRLEQNAENRRQTLHQEKRTNLLANIDQGQATLLELQADIRTAKLVYRETLESLNNDITSRDAKQEQLDDQRAACTNAVSALKSRIENYQEILDIIRQVIILLENSSISQSTLMVSDLDDDSSSSSGQGSLLGSYNSDSGTLPTHDGGNTYQFIQKQKSYLGYDPLSN